MKLNAKEYMLACLFHPQRESRILLHLNKLCSLAAVHVRLGLPPVRAMRSWRDGNQGFVRGSRRLLGSCKQEKRPGRLQREKSGCPKKEKGKRPCQGKKKKKHRNLLQRPCGKEAEGKPEEAVWKKHRPRDWERHRGDKLRRAQCTSCSTQWNRFGIWPRNHVPLDSQVPTELFPRENTPFTCSGSFLWT